jgi:CHAT domain-containing protein
MALATKDERSRIEQQRAAFAAFQLVMLGDTAATLQAANKRRIASVPGLGDAIKDRTEAEILLERYEGILKGFKFVRFVGVERELAATQIALRNATERIKQLWREDPLAATLEPVDMEDAAKVLSPREGLVVVHIGRTSVLGFALLAGGRARVWSRAATREDIARAVTRVRAGAVITERFPDFPVNAAADLFETLLGPIKSELEDVDQIVSITDGPLQSLPLGILPTARLAQDPIGSEALRNAGVKWLVLSHAVSASPSVRTFLDQRGSIKASGSSRPFLGIGDPLLSGANDRGRAVDFKQVYSQGNLANVEALRRMGSLPETAIELKALAKAFSADESEVLLGANATERRVKVLPLALYRVIAFATHGLVAGDGGPNVEPGLVLTPPPVASTADDGLLTASEIMALRLDADLVLLSACDTASADGRPRADALSGLARAFFAAGARNLIVTHWAIPSLPTVEITTRSASTWTENRSINWARALQQAQIFLLTRPGRPEFAHPASWGAFQVVGAAAR